MKTMIRRDETDLRLAILCAVRSPANFGHEDIAKAMGCDLALVAEIAAMVDAINPVPTNPMTQEQIARIIGISSQGVRNIEHIAFQRMRHPNRMKMLIQLREELKEIY